MQPVAQETWLPVLKAHWKAGKLLRGVAHWRVDDPAEQWAGKELYTHYWYSDRHAKLNKKGELYFLDTGGTLTLSNFNIYVDEMGTVKFVSKQNPKVYMTIRMVDNVPDSENSEGA